MAVNIKLDEKSINMGKSRKPNNPKKKKIITSIIVTILIVATLLGGYFLAQRAGVKLGVTDIFYPIKANPQLEKDSSGKYTNVLFVGIDSRGANSGLQNTDTIMLVSYNYEENYAVMTSIPRDFFVEVPEQPGRYSKINGIYAIGERIETGSGLEYLQGVVEEVTGREIQYYGMVNLEGFVDLIDTIGGIEVDVENAFTDYRYPVEGAESRYQTVSFQSGPQDMDGRTALRFVRSRLSGSALEGSDFARARRQQRVIEAVKNELLSSSTYLNPKRIFEIIGVLENNIKFSEFTNEEIQAALKIFQKEDMKTYSFVLDPSLANYKLITDKGITLTGYTIGPVAGLCVYEEIHKYIQNAHEKPILYSEDPVILIYDIGIGYDEGLEKAIELEEMHPYIQIQYMGTLLSEFEDNYLFKNLETEEENGKVLDEKYFPITMTEKPEFVEEMTFNGDYIILLGAND
jgi:polyisoprenyl-teichoic acid--peptidoglycan teichoic acid transferase